jgi:hypothetical protein
MALDAQRAAFVYIYAGIPRIAEIHTSFYATEVLQGAMHFKNHAASDYAMNNVKAYRHLRLRLQLRFLSIL